MQPGNDAGGLVEGDCASNSKGYILYYVFVFATYTGGAVEAALTSTTVLGGMNEYPENCLQKSVWHDLFSYHCDSRPTQSSYPLPVRLCLLSGQYCVHSKQLL